MQDCKKQRKEKFTYFLDSSNSQIWEEDYHK
jgi:hypothetical protein